MKFCDISVPLSSRNLLGLNLPPYFISLIFWSPFKISLFCPISPSLDMPSHQPIQEIKSLRQCPHLRRHQSLTPETRGTPIIVFCPLHFPPLPYVGICVHIYTPTLLSNSRVLFFPFAQYLWNSPIHFFSSPLYSFMTLLCTNIGS